MGQKSGPMLAIRRAKAARDQVSGHRPRGRAFAPASPIARTTGARSVARSRPRRFSRRGGAPRAPPTIRPCSEGRPLHLRSLAEQAEDLIVREEGVLLARLLAKRPRGHPGRGEPRREDPEGVGGWVHAPIRQEGEHQAERHLLGQSRRRWERQDPPGRAVVHAAREQVALPEELRAPDQALQLEGLRRCGRRRPCPSSPRVPRSAPSR